MNDAKRIEEILRSVLARLQAGKRVDIEEILRSNADLCPTLQQRLEQLMEAFQIGVSDREQREESFYSDQSKNAPTREFEGDRSTQLPHACRQCGTLALIQDELDHACRECGFVNPLALARAKLPDTGLGMLAHFQLLELIGSGGFGLVYRAQDTVLDRQVAIKVPRPEYFQTFEQQERFMREARHAAQLSHPGIVPVYEFGDVDQPYIVTEFVAGPSLADLISSDAEPLSYQQIGKLVLQIAQAIAFAHKHKVIHRDLKPNNILLDETLTPYVADFGMSRFVENEPQLTLDGQTMGTPAYMSPEQVAGDQEKIKYATDIYSLGVILYLLLTGELPFRGGKRAIIYQVINEEPLPPRTLDDEIPLDLETITLKAMSKEQDRRYETVDELAKELDRFLKGEPIVARPVGRVEKTRLWCRRNPVIAQLALAVGLLLFASLIGLTYWAIRENNNLVKMEAALSREKKERLRADTAAIDGQARLVRQYTHNGERSLSDGDRLMALPWMVNAWQLDLADKRSDMIHRLKLGTTLQGTPRLISLQAGPSRVRTAIFGPNCELAACGFLQDGFVVWHISSGKVVLREQRDLEIDAMAFSPDGRQLAVACPDGRAQIWDLQSKQARTLEHASKVLQIGFSDDGASLATLCVESNEVVVWDTATGNVVSRLDHQQSLVKFKFHGNMLFTVDRPSHELGRVFRWTLDPEPVVSKICETKSRFINLAFGDLKEVLLVVCENETTGWRAAGLSMDQVFEVPHDSHPVTARLSSDQKLIAALRNGNLETWDVTLPEPSVSTIRTGDRVRQIAFCDDPNLIGIANEGIEAFVWRLSPPGLVCPGLAHSKSVVGTVLSPGGRYIMTFSFDGLAKIWDLQTPRLASPSVQHHNEMAEPIAGLRVSADSKLIAIAGRNHAAYVRTLQDGSIVGNPMPHPDEVIRTDFSPDCRTLVTACKDGIVRLWDVESSSQIPTDEPMQHPVFVSRVHFTPDGRSIVSGDAVGNIVVWNARNGKTRFEMKHQLYIISFDFSPDGKRLSSSSADGTAKIWDLATGKQIGKDLRHETPPIVMCCRFSPDGTKLITAGQDGSSCLWDAWTGEQLGNRQRHNSSVWDARFHPSKSAFLTASNDGNAYFWNDFHDPSQAISVKTFGVRFGNYEAPFRLDGNVFMTATNAPVSPQRDRRRYAGAAQLWDPQTGDLVSPLFGSYGYLTDAQYSPDGKYIAVADDAGMLRIWAVVGEQRSRKRMQEIAEVLSGHQVGPRSDLIALPALELAKRWQQLRQQGAREVSSKNFMGNDHLHENLVPLEKVSGTVLGF